MKPYHYLWLFCIVLLLGLLNNSFIQEVITKREEEARAIKVMRKKIKEEQARTAKAVKEKEIQKKVAEAQKKAQEENLGITRIGETIKITRKAWPELFHHIAYLKIDCNIKDQYGLPLGQILLLKTGIKKEVIVRELTGEKIVVNKNDSKLKLIDVHFKNQLGMAERETFLGGTKTVIFEPITRFVDNKQIKLNILKDRIKNLCNIPLKTQSI